MSDARKITIIDTSTNHPETLRAIREQLEHRRDLDVLAVDLEPALRGAADLAGAFDGLNVALRDLRPTMADLLADWKRLAVEMRREKASRERARRLRRYRHAHRARRSKKR